MNSPSAQGNKADPLAPYATGAVNKTTGEPIPLATTRFKVRILGGLAIVETTRLFRNAEKGSIEATITLPVPVHATVFALRARIGERVLHAKACRKQQAREDYEEAIETGKTAVLHEEVLRGVHMLSIGHLPAGTEVEVMSTWVTSLTHLGDHSSLRIPLTVGDIYGRSGLHDADDLVHGGPVQIAELRVDCPDGSVALSGGKLRDGCASIPLNAPIDLQVKGCKPSNLYGITAGGREVMLRIEPAVGANADLDTAILIDHSGSMAEICSGEGRGLTKHQALLWGLEGISGQISGADYIELYEFDNRLTRVAEARGQEAFLHALKKLSAPAGGTEIGAALEQLIGKSEVRDILLVTDGKSYAVDVQKLAAKGRRISLVLIGEDSLEANVGHLAALTGGEIFVATGEDLAHALRTALRSLRASPSSALRLNGKGLPREIAVTRAGMKITARFGEEVTGGAADRAVAALAASLALPGMSEEVAAELAEAEGLITHLTSYILVDEAGGRQAGPPATRKVALPSPRTLAMHACLSLPSAGAVSFERFRFKTRLFSRAYIPRESAIFDDLRKVLRSPVTTWDGQIEKTDLSGVGSSLDWSDPERLKGGDLGGLDPHISERIRAAAAQPEVVALATRLGLDPVVVVIGLIARAIAKENQLAGRFERALFGRRAKREIDSLAQSLFRA
jgi:hypothetical protein